MPTIEDAINTYLLTQTAITAYVGANIFHCSAPNNLEEDFIRYQTIDAENIPIEFGDKKTAQPLIQFDVFSKNDSNALAISYALVDALHGFSGSLATGLSVIISTVTGPRVIRDQNEEWFHGIIEWKVEYTRS